MSGQCDYCSSNPCACWIDNIDSDISVEKQLEQSQANLKIAMDALNSICSVNGHISNDIATRALQKIKENTCTQQY